jgi:CcmD family protein
MKRRLLAVLCVLAAAVVPVLAGQPPAGQSEFVPVGELPPTEQLPGGVFVVVAYGLIWVALVAYLWSIWRRLGRVEAELRTLERRSVPGSGAR